MVQEITSDKFTEASFASCVDSPFKDIANVAQNMKTISCATLDPLCKKHSLDESAIFMLLFLEKAPDSMLQGLNLALCTKRANIMRTLRNLEYKNLVTIGINNDETYHRLVNLTDKGREIAFAIVADLEETRFNLEGIVGEEKVTVLKEAWHAFCSSIAEIAADLEGCV